ncbi:exported hypothetical protein [Agrobacterium tumefaciens str. B6]|uniref:Secreted protein n=1 Tax=Agrobacterium tumefaciens str. B6 TaxID=1183423 RepID=A0A822V8V7_AGRTU|nr:exported hypothetical protein [Agrobacterium tumefaciens str. B6]
MFVSTTMRLSTPAALNCAFMMPAAASMLVTRAGAFLSASVQSLTLMSSAKAMAGKSAPMATVAARERDLNMRCIPVETDYLIKLLNLQLYDISGTKAGRAELWLRNETADLRVSARHRAHFWVTSGARARHRGSNLRNIATSHRRP